jgi:hypothetical protein
MLNLFPPFPHRLLDCEWLKNAERGDREMMKDPLSITSYLIFVGEGH